MEAPQRGVGLTHVGIRHIREGAHRVERPNRRHTLATQRVNNGCREAVINTGAAVKKDPAPGAQNLVVIRAGCLELLNQRRAIGQRRFPAIGLVDQTMQKLKARRDFPGGQVGMRAQPESRIGRRVGFGVARQIDVGFDIPQQTKVAVAHRANARGEFSEKPWLIGCLLNYTHTQTQQVVEHVAKRVIVLKHRISLTARRRRQPRSGPSLRGGHPALWEVLPLRDVPEPARVISADHTLIGTVRRPSHA